LSQPSSAIPWLSAIREFEKFSLKVLNCWIAANSGVRSVVSTDFNDLVASSPFKSIEKFFELLDRSRNQSEKQILVLGALEEVDVRASNSSKFVGIFPRPLLCFQVSFQNFAAKNATFGRLT
jgi:hypothetical protein